MSSRATRRSIAVVLILTTAGCMRWTMPHTSGPAGVEARTFHVARVTAEPYGAFHVLRYVTVTADSVTGIGEGGARVAFHWSEVRRVEERRVSTLRTVGAGLGALVLVAAYVVSTISY
jgi:hypothetical protein